MKPPGFSRGLGPPQLTGFGDFYWFACEPPEDSGLHPAEETARLVVDIVGRRVPARFGLDPVRDVQVLTPTHRGPAGAASLNSLLQEALTPRLWQRWPTAVAESTASARP